MKPYINQILTHALFIIIVMAISSCTSRELASLENYDDIIHCRVIGPKPCKIDSSENSIYLVQAMNDDFDIGSTIYYGRKYYNVVEVTGLPDELKRNELEICFRFKIPEEEEKIIEVCPANTVIFLLNQISFIEQVNCDN